MPMDLTSLSSTLPHSLSQSHHNVPTRPSEDDSPSAILMSAFKQAALSVTHLYKSGNTEIERSRKLGYQDCLEDLQQLLESDHFQPNSEVRKIREWVLSKQRSKFGGSQRKSDPAEDSEDGEPKIPTRSPSSPLQSEPQLAAQQDACQATPQSFPPPTLSTLLTTPPPPPQQPILVHKENGSAFSFRSQPRLPQHPPPPPSVPVMGDINIVDADSNAPILFAQQQSGFFSPQNRTSSGALKRRFPYNDFLELAATAEKERDWVNKRGRLG